MIVHITSKKDWQKAQESGEYTASSLKDEGFIHCSTVKQIVDTANLFYKGQGGLKLLCINEEQLTSQCKYEDPAGGGNHDPGVGALFPHVYGPINLFAVIKVLDFPCDKEGLFALPEGL